MTVKSLTYSIGAAIVFCALAVTFAGAGGLVEGRWRTTLAACSGFWLLMLLVPWAFLSQRPLSLVANLAITTAVGAIAGLCFSLCFQPGSGAGSMFRAMLVGAMSGFGGFWASWLRYYRVS